MNSRNAEISASAERFRREGIAHGRSRGIARTLSFARPQLRIFRLRAAHR
jgi:hypothetical protein